MAQFISKIIYVCDGLVFTPDLESFVVVVVKANPRQKHTSFN